MDLIKNARWFPRWSMAQWFMLATALAGSGTMLRAEQSASSALNLQNRPALGAETAAVTVVEISSFKCTHCRDFHAQVFPILREQYINSGKVRWVVLNASDDPSDQYTKPFALARCALRQGKYWEVVDELFRVAHRPSSFIEDTITANEHIDRDELALCLRDRTIRSAVAGDFEAYSKLKLKGTPSFIVSKTGRDGQRIETVISGAEKLAYFQRVIDELLKLP